MWQNNSKIPCYHETNAIWFRDGWFQVKLWNKKKQNFLEPTIAYAKHLDLLYKKNIFFYKDFFKKKAVFEFYQIFLNI
jgi:hypothetical protein